MPNRRSDDTTYPLGVFASGVLYGSVQYVKGGEYAFFLDATANAGTLSLQMQSPSGVWIDVQAYGVFMRTTNLTMNQVGLTLPAGAARMNATGSVTGVSAWLVGAG